VRKGEASRSAEVRSGQVRSGAAPAHVPVPPRILWAGDGNGLAQLGTLGIVLWRGGILSIIEENAPVPDEAMRRESAQQFKRMCTHVTGFACVIEATGFVGALQRSVLSSMGLLLPRGHCDVKFCAHVRIGAEWIAPRCEGVAIETLCSLVEDLRSSLSLRGFTT
jgi:hypothetical protein